LSKRGGDGVRVPEEEEDGGIAILGGKVKYSIRKKGREDLQRRVGQGQGGGGGRVLRGLRQKKKSVISLRLSYAREGQGSNELFSQKKR